MQKFVPLTSNFSKSQKLSKSRQRRARGSSAVFSAEAMATFRRFRPDDVNKFSKCNLDPLTETYDLRFYLQYFAKWPSLFQVCEDADGNIIGYSEFEEHIGQGPILTPKLDSNGKG